jgi:hypothetical protein
MFSDEEKLKNDTPANPITRKHEDFLFLEN